MRIGFAVTALICISGFSSCKNVTEPPFFSLRGTWAVESVSDPVGAGGVPVSRLYLFTFLEDGTIRGNGPCNDCSGFYEHFADGHLQAGVGCTEAACDDAGAYANLIGSGRRFDIVGNRLTIFAGTETTDRVLLTLIRVRTENAE